MVEELPRAFPGQTLTMREIYERHSVDTPFVPANYKEAIRLLERAGRVSVEPPAAKRRKRKGIVTVADGTRVTFPQS